MCENIAKYIFYFLPMSIINIIGNLLKMYKNLKTFYILNIEYIEYLMSCIIGFHTKRILIQLSCNFDSIAMYFMISSIINLYLRIYEYIGTYKLKPPMKDEQAAVDATKESRDTRWDLN